MNCSRFISVKSEFLYQMAISNANQLLPARSRLLQKWLTRWESMAKIFSHTRIREAAKKPTQTTCSVCNHNSRCLSQSPKPSEPTPELLCSTLTFLFICLLCNSETYLFSTSRFFFSFAFNANRVVYVRFHLRMPRGEPTLAAPFTMPVFMRSEFFNCPFFV